MSITLSDPMILNPRGDPEVLEELEQLDDREKFGEKIYERSEEQKAQDRRDTTDALEKAIRKLELTEE